MGLGLGFSFGKKKQNSSGTGTVDKTTALTGVQDSSTQTSGTTTQNQQGFTSSTQQNNTSGLTTQDNRTTSDGTQRTTGTTTTLGADIQEALNSKVLSLLGGDPTGLEAAAAGRTGFNVDEFVAQTVGAARNRGEQTLQEQTSAFGSNVGGSAGTNSMVALLAQRGRNDLEATLGGISADARAKGEGIANENLKTAAGVTQGVNSLVTELAGSLKGATTTTDMTQLTSQIEALIGKGSTLGAGTQTGTEATAQQSTTNQLLQEIAKVLTDQTQHEVGTETQTTKGKSGGFGLSLGI